METTFSTGFNPVNSMLFNNTAKEIHSTLSFAMKCEYDVQCIAYILELQEEYTAIKKFWCNGDATSDQQIDQKEMILYIIDRINRLGIFPTHSEVKKILGMEEENLAGEAMFMVNETFMAGISAA